MSDFLSSLPKDAQDASLFAESFYHGENHWRAVADQGLWLAERLRWSREKRIALFVFGAVHDCRRENDDYDPEHGPRAADWLRDHPIWNDTTLISRSVWADIDTALRLHDTGQTRPDTLIGACWDSDRSLLGRVGITPNPIYFSTVPSPIFNEFTRRGEQVSDEPDTWDNMLERALRTTSRFKLICSNR